ncbi:Crp/Fnr family transcriptional regulator [Tunicatimonas pelagia]|uniref:Crp/Fnr family transcriptional regulator n=1 Tax=Tunicatimonas pelagia TaxID=931531 RepID=UPI0026666235|nr:Crp/Fnr family transcriptional regulator [Tunicatimonas pelagia]WKN41164.1 Crp/Fnr family transcriptional regulator [Tunicatimonas pelagia]
MLQHFSKIEQLINSFDKPTKRVLEEIAVVKHFKKGDILLAEGEICRRSFHLTRGIARKYYLKDGKEVTTEFYFEDDLAVAFSSYAFQEPSREYIDCLSDLSASVTDYRAFQQAKQRFPKLMELDLLLTEVYAGWLEESLFDHHSLSATERYEKLLEQTPYLLQHIKLTHIASYLGISLETLSRIRAKK